MAVKAKWKGKSHGEEGYEFVTGVPARDLSDEDYKALEPEMKKAVRDSALYDVQTEPTRSSSSSGSGGSRAANEGDKS
jgi:hypothetical protein